MTEAVLWGGKPLRDWVPDVVHDIVRRYDPCQIILFGSAARGEEGPDSDLDLLVIFDSLHGRRRVDLMGEIRFAVKAPAPLDILVTEVAEFERHKDTPGTMHYWPAHEGTVVYDRAA